MKKTLLLQQQQQHLNSVCFKSRVLLAGSELSSSTGFKMLVHNSQHWIETINDKSKDLKIDSVKRIARLCGNGDL